jgi:hypothetical protein
MVGIFRNNIISIKGIFGTIFIKIAIIVKRIAAISIIKIPCVFTLFLAIFIDDD